MTELRKPKPIKWELGSVKGTVVLHCPDCGNVMVLMTCDIQADGVALPFIMCPSLKCHFHGDVILEGWVAQGGR